jgi:hypothetical protein
MLSYLLIHLIHIDNSIIISIWTNVAVEGKPSHMVQSCANYTKQKLILL